MEETPAVAGKKTNWHGKCTNRHGSRKAGIELGQTGMEAGQAGIELGQTGMEAGQPGIELGQTGMDEGQQRKDISNQKRTLIIQRGAGGNGDQLMN